MLSHIANISILKLLIQTFQQALKMMKKYPTLDIKTKVNEQTKEKKTVGKSPW